MVSDIAFCEPSGSLNETYFTIITENSRESCDYRKFRRAFFEKQKLTTVALRVPFEVDVRSEQVGVSTFSQVTLFEQK